MMTLYSRHKTIAVPKFLISLNANLMVHLKNTTHNSEADKQRSQTQHGEGKPTPATEWSHGASFGTWKKKGSWLKPLPFLVSCGTLRKERKPNFSAHNSIL